MFIANVLAVSVEARSVASGSGHLILFEKGPYCPLHVVFFKGGYAEVDAWVDAFCARAVLAKMRTKT
jgi:hypothetical protein